MRLLTLYLRARGVPVALTSILLVTLGFWALDTPDPRLLALTIGLGVSVAAGGLGGYDVDLDRTAAIPWPPRRALHLAAIVAIVSGLVIVTGLGIAEIIVRTSVGLTGLAAIGATLLSRQLAWGPPVTWTLCAVVFPITNEAVNWMQEPPGVTAANLTSAVIGVLGATLYAVVGPRASS